jgi:hypothetical protein
MKATVIGLLFIIFVIFMLCGKLNCLPYSDVKIVTSYNDEWPHTRYYLKKKCLIWFTIDWVWLYPSVEDWKAHYKIEVEK